jgi:hypothetical protein
MPQQLADGQTVMCLNLFHYLLETRGAQQKTIIFSSSLLFFSFLFFSFLFFSSLFFSSSLLFFSSLFFSSLLLIFCARGESLDSARRLMYFQRDFTRPGEEHLEVESAKGKKSMEE